MMPTIALRVRNVLLFALLCLGVSTLMAQAKAVAAAAASSTACPTSLGSLDGWYGMLVAGSTVGGNPAPKYLTGALLFDGAGNVSGNHVYAGTAAVATATGSYVLNSDCTLTLMLTVGSSAVQTYSLGIAKVDEAFGVETDASAVATIDLQAQYSTVTTGLNFNSSSLNGTFAASCLGPIGGESDLNLETFTNGSLSGTDAYNNSGSFAVSNVSFAGSYSVNSDGTFLGSLVILGTTVDFFGVISNSGTGLQYIYSNVSGSSATAPFASCSGGTAQAATPAPTFTLSPASATLAVVQNQQASEAIKVVPANGFTESVSFAATGLPSGVTVSFSPTSSTTGSTLTVAAAAGAAAGAFSLSVTGTSAATGTASSITQTAVIKVTVSAASSGGGTGVNLQSVDNVYAVANSGGAPVNGGLDGSGYAYSASLLGTSLTYNGASFTLGSAGAASAVANAVITLPAGNYATLSFLGTGVFGSQTNQPFVVTYTDGSTTTFTQSLSDWGAPQKFTGESIVSTMTSRVTPSGATQAGPWYLYGYSFALNNAKTVKSLKLPANRNVIVLAVDLSKTAGSPPAAQTITFGTIASQNVGATIALGATASSGLPVTYASTTASVCTVSGSNATMVAAGTCSIVASQGGSTAYAAATPVTQSFAVVSSAGSFTLKPSSGSVYVTAPVCFFSVCFGGHPGYDFITLSAVNGFSGTASFSVSGVPSWITASFNPTSISRAGSTTLTLSPKSSSGGAHTNGTPLVITATSGTGASAVTATTTITLHY